MLTNLTYPDESAKLRRYRVSGMSMLPSLRDGDEILIDTSKNPAPGIGNLLLYQRSPDSPVVLHRLIQRDGSTLQMAGDAHPEHRESITLDHWIGTGVALLRNRRMISSGIHFALRNRLLFFKHHRFALTLIGIKRFAIQMIDAVLRVQLVRRMLRKTFTASGKLSRATQSKCWQYELHISNHLAARMDIQFDADQIAFISNLQVRARYRGRGIAQRVLSKCLEDLKKSGIHFVRLKVLENSKPAIHLYEKMGFRRTGNLEESAGPLLASRKIILMEYECKKAL